MPEQSKEVRDLNQLALMIGSVSGQITQLQYQMQQGHDNTNKRIDDLRGSIDRSSKVLNQRIDDHKAASDIRFQTIEKDLRTTRNKSYAGSGVVAAALTGFFKLMEYVIKGP